MSEEKKYLNDLNAQLTDCIEQIKTVGEDAAAIEKVFSLLNSIVVQEDELRTKYDIGVRFNVVRTQLQSVLKEFDKELAARAEESQDDEKEEQEISSDETLVYVYLFNAQGSILKSWQKLLSPGAMFEHSVNRPIYSELSAVEAMLREKPNIENHAYIIVAIKNADVLEANTETALKDQYGQPLLRLRQGALKTENIKRFVHLNREYNVSSEGMIQEI